MQTKDNLVLTLKEGLKCLLCTHTLSSPVQLNCLHAFCYECALKHLHPGALCPLCREIVTFSKPSPVISLIVRQLKNYETQDQETETESTEDRVSQGSRVRLDTRREEVKEVVPGKLEIPLDHLVRHMDSNGLFPGFSKGFLVKKVFEYLGINTRKLEEFSMKAHESVEHVMVVSYACKSLTQYNLVRRKLSHLNKGTILKVAESLRTY